MVEYCGLTTREQGMESVTRCQHNSLMCDVDKVRESNATCISVSPPDPLEAGLSRQIFIGTRDTGLAVSVALRMGQENGTTFPISTSHDLWATTVSSLGRIGQHEGPVVVKGFYIVLPSCPR